jgi:hypothetical protein
MIEMLTSSSDASAIGLTADSLADLHDALATITGAIDASF